MKQTFSVTCIMMIVLALFSCKDKSVTKREVTGKPGELVVVIPKETWDGKVGDAMKKVLLQPQLGLAQQEPLFTTIAIPPAAFKEIFRTSGNIINVWVSPTLDSAKVEFKEDVWAWPQSVVNIDAKSSDECIDLFNQHADKILSFLLKAERDRLQMNYAKNVDKAVKNTIRKKFNIDLDIPAGFKVAVDKDDFIWLRYDTPETTQGIAIYTFPYKSDSTFTVKYLLNKRDSILGRNIEGSLPGSFMSTEHLLPLIFRVSKVKNNHSAEMRGLWKMVNDYMDGPFINLSVLDVSNNRVIMMDGLVYAPRFDKRNYLRQVEAMVYSLELHDQKENDKINR